MSVCGTNGRGIGRAVALLPPPLDLVAMQDTVRIALIGDFDPSVTAHQSIPAALKLAGTAVGAHVDGCWLATERIADAPSLLLQSFDAFWCVPASPYRSTKGALRAIQYARENGFPFLGTCGGFQHAVIEIARDALGIGSASHAELEPDADRPFITPLSCALVEVTGRIMLQEGSRLRSWYGAPEIEEGYHCSYGLNDDRRAELEAGGVSFTAFANDGTVRAFELTNHPFFVCTLFQPERAALRGKTSPPVVQLIRAALQKKASPPGSGAIAQA